MLILLGVGIATMFDAVSAIISGWLLITGGIAYIANSFEKLPLGRMGCITFGGEPVLEVESGWIFRPLFLFELAEVSTAIITYSFDGETKTENVGLTALTYHTDRFRVTLPSLQASDAPAALKEIYKNKTDDPLTAQLTIDPTIIISIKIKEGQVSDFIKSVRDFQNLLILLRRTTEGLLQEVLEKTAAIDARLCTNKLSDDLHDRVVALINKGPDPWGVEVVVCKISSWGFPRRVNEALADLAQSIALAAKAEHDKHATIFAGQATAEVAKLAGLAEQEIAAKKAETASSPEGALMVAIEAAVEMAAHHANGRASTIIVPSGDSGLAGMLASLKAILGRVHTPEGTYLAEEVKPAKLKPEEEPK